MLSVFPSSGCLIPYVQFIAVTDTTAVLLYVVAFESRANFPVGTIKYIILHRIVSYRIVSLDILQNQ